MNGFLAIYLLGGALHVVLLWRAFLAALHSNRFNDRPAFDGITWWRLLLCFAIVACWPALFIYNTFQGYREGGI